jgi:hypothetical protein
MSENDSNRFLVVSAFFGVGTIKETKSSSPSHVTHGRQGVGSTAVKMIIKPVETVGLLPYVAKQQRLEEEEDDHYKLSFD